MFPQDTWEQVGNRHAPWWLYVCNKAGVPLEIVKDPAAMSFTQRHGATSTGEIALDSRHARTADLMADGARYRLVSTLTGNTISTGQVRSDRGEAHPDGHEGGQIGTTTWTLVDDHALLTDVLVLPASAQPNNTQRAAAETASRSMIVTNLSRLSIPHTIPATANRGAQVTLTGRYQPIADVIYPAITNAGIGWRVWWANDQYNLSCYAPQVWPKRVTAHSGMVTEWAWSREYPAATRVRILGPREGLEQLVRERINGPLEAALGYIREATVDASVKDVDPDEGRTLSDVYAEMDEAGDQFLTEAARTVGLRVDLAALPEFRWGDVDGLRAGDILETQLVPTRAPVALSLSEIHMSWTPEEGFRVVPRVGEFIDSPIRSLAKRVHELSVGWRRQKASI